MGARGAIWAHIQIHNSVEVEGATRNAAPLFVVEGPISRMAGRWLSLTLICKNSNKGTMYTSHQWIKQKIGDFQNGPELN